jgi:hypothetical protein
MKILICGKVTGLNYEYACSQFERAEIYLRSQGHTVYNPCKIIPPGTPWVDALRITLNIILNEGLDAVYMLKGHAN